MAFTGTDHDRDLALLAASSDRNAFEGLYDRWFQALYDFVLHTVHDVDLAADVLRATYTRAWNALRRGATPLDVRGWLFGLAHDAAIDDIRRRSSLLDSSADLGDEEEDLDFAKVDASRLVNPEPISRDPELVKLVWEAVETLSPRDYMLLDMHLRQGFTPDELTEALALKRGAVQPALTRLRQGLEEAVTYTLLLRRGRRECSELDALLSTMEGRELRPETIRLIERHLSECAACSQRRYRYPSPVEIFAALAPVAAPARLRHSVWRRISDYLESGAPPPAGAAWWQERRVRVAALAAAVVILAAIVVTPFATAARNAVRDPAAVHSTSHQLGQSSDTRVIAVSWDPDPKAQAFAVRWSQQPKDVPDAKPDLAGAATGTSSPALEDGTWYFHLRTEGANGQWTSTVHLGPFVIAGATPTAVPPPTDTPLPTAPASAAAVATPTADKPSATPTVARTPTATVKPGATQTAAAETATARAAATAKASATAAAAHTSASASAAPAAAPPPPTATPPPAPTATPKPTCATAFGNPVLAATTGSGNRVAVNWGSNGGCGPYKGSISARYQQDTAAYTTYPISEPSGGLTDPAPARCPGTFTVVYTMSLQDSAGQTVNASASTKVVWVC